MTSPRVWQAAVDEVADEVVKIFFLRVVHVGWLIAGVPILLLLLGLEANNPVFTQIHIAVDLFFSLFFFFAMKVFTWDNFLCLIASILELDVKMAAGLFNQILDVDFSYPRELVGCSSFFPETCSGY
jgi:hypothetical protein